MFNLVVLLLNKYHGGMSSKISIHTPKHTGVYCIEANSGTIPGNIEQQVSHNIIHGIKGLLCPAEPTLPRDDGAVSLDH